MNERGWIEPIVERVVSQVLEANATQLRTEIVRRVMEEIAGANPNAGTLEVARNESGAQPVNGNAASAADPASLAHAVAEIQAGASQREILRALLDTSARHAARVALFVVKGSRATGWQARGFANCDAVKDFALEESTPAVVCAIRDRVLTTATADDLDPRFLQQVGTPSSAEAQILPLVLKDKVAALLYADSGTDSAGLLDVGSLQLLVLSTTAWLEVNSLRKQAQKEPSSPTESGNVARSDEAPYRNPAPTAQPNSAFNDPFASHTPAFSSGQAMAAAASASEASVPAASSAVEIPTVSPTTMESPTMSASAAATAVAESVVEDAVSTESQSGVAEMDASPAGYENPAISEPPASLSPEDQDVHRKAQRFARLLVDEIKLYNQAKVSEGRTNKDLYDRLKEVIEKSRVTYQKRYGTTVAASGNYFQHEIIRSLAEDDLSIMGANFRH